MNEEFEKRLDFDSDTFDQMKKDMNFVLQRLIGNMQEKGTNEGSMALKIDVTMVKEFVPNYDPDIEGETREISKPQFKHKVTSAVKINDEKSGAFNNEMELVLDEDTGVFKLVPIANTSQRSIFDSDFQQQDYGCEKEDEESVDSNAIEGGKVPMLPESDIEGEIIDGEFREENGEELSEKTGVRKCITGWSRYGVCICCGYGGVQCCKQCKDPCNSRCGWIDDPYISKNETESGDELEDITDELLGPEETDDGYGYEEPED